MKILLVDDNKIIRDGIRTILSLNDSYSCVGECEDGDEVIPFLEKHPVDLILMDISMKRMDGITATRHVTSQFPEVKVIMLTMHDQETYFNNVRDAGAKAYLLKNVGIDVIFQTIDEVMNGKNTFISN